MRRSGNAGQKLVALFGVGVVLLDYPILSLFTGTADVGGVPLLYAYVFGVWAALIALMAFAIERRRD